MKYIFDFDDVIFRTTKHRLEQMFPLLEKAGATREKIEEYYAKMRLEGFSLKGAIAYLFDDVTTDKDQLYERIMSSAEQYTNSELVDMIRKLGKENCFLITHGGDEFQKEKIERAGVTSLFSETIILVGSKKKAVENICERYKDEPVVFIDDKPQYFADLDLKKYSNLRTILYTGQKAEELERAIKS